MRSVYKRLDPAIQSHLLVIREGAGLPEGASSLEALAQDWMNKENAFQEQRQAMGMEEATECRHSGRGMLALTYSGSLVAIGPQQDGKRRAVYVSIDRRRDVPSRVEHENAILSGSVQVGCEIVFNQGPVKQSSAVYRLALLPEDLPALDQNTRLDEATLVLTREFAAVDGTRMTAE